MKQGILDVNVYRHFKDLYIFPSILFVKVT